MRRFIGMLLVLFTLTSCASTSPAPVTVTEPAPASQPVIITTDVPKQAELTFVEFFAITWVDCKQMDPIVHGLIEKYKQCMKLERVNYHQHTPWHDLIYPLAAPEFALLDSSKNILYRWFGVIEEEEFSAVLDPLCSS